VRRSLTAARVWERQRAKHQSGKGTGGPKQRQKEEARPPGQKLQEEPNSLMSKKTHQLKILESFKHWHKDCLLI
jgi:hypothetical protein